MSTLRIKMKDEVVKHVIDLGAVSIWAAAMMELLPPIAAALSIVWLSIQIVDYIVKKVKK